MSKSKLYQINVQIYVGSNQRVAPWTSKALQEMGVKEEDLKEIKAVLTAKILSEAALRPFSKLRKRVQEYLTSHGERHPLVGWLINPSEREEIIKYLEEVRQEYLAEKSRFLGAYESACRQQQESLRALAEAKGLDPQPLLVALEAKQPPVAYYEKVMEFEFFDSMMEIDPVWKDRVENVISSITSKTVAWVAEAAQEAALAERPSTRVKILQKVARKLNSMSFYIPTIPYCDPNIIVGKLEGIKPSSAYSPAASIISIRLAKEVASHAERIVLGETRIESLIASAEQFAQQVLSEEQEELALRDQEAEAEAAEAEAEAAEAKTEAEVPVGFLSF